MQNPMKYHEAHNAVTSVSANLYPILKLNSVLVTASLTCCACRRRLNGGKGDEGNGIGDKIGRMADVIFFG